MPRNAVWATALLEGLRSSASAGISRCREAQPPLEDLLQRRRANELTEQVASAGVFLRVGGQLGEERVLHHFEAADHRREVALGRAALVAGAIEGAT